MSPKKGAGVSDSAIAFFDDLADRVEQSRVSKAHAVEISREVFSVMFEKQRDVTMAVFAQRVRFFSLLIPRRGAKSWLLVALSVILCVCKPFAIVPFISLTKDSAKRIFWDIIKWFDRRFDLGLKFNENELSFVYQNGSRGFLHGCLQREELEKLRGFESDMNVIDECGALPPSIIDELVNKILFPLCMSRRAILAISGTPGQFLSGEFFLATAPHLAVDENKMPYAMPWEERETARWTGRPWLGSVDHDLSGVSDEDMDAFLEKVLDSETKWVLFRWGIKDNKGKGMEHQWAEALRIKKANRWGDDHPDWQAEYLAIWVAKEDALVYAYHRLKKTGRVTWKPDYVEGLPVSGLPKGKEWRFVMGIDFGFDPDPTVFVIGAYSPQDPCLYYCWDWGDTHLTTFQVVDKIRELEAVWGMFDAIVVDPSDKQMVESMNIDHGLNLIWADRHKKPVYQERLNSDFHSGLVKLIEDSDLAREMEALQWDLRGEKKKDLIRKGKLKEVSSMPNHRCDAALYLWRYSAHLWGRDVAETKETAEEAWRRWDRDQARAAVERRNRDEQGGLMEQGTQLVLEGTSLIQGLPSYVRNLKRG